MYNFWSDCISGAARCTTGATPRPPACSSSTTSRTSSPTSGNVTEGLHTVVNTPLSSMSLLCRGGLYVVEGSDFILPVGDRKGGDSCSHQLCECDRKFVSCLSRYNCPQSKAMCKSPWRYFQNLFMGLGTGMVNFPSVEKRSELLYCLKLIPVFHVIYHWP